jgi:hypothetical protein
MCESKNKNMAKLDAEKKRITNLETVLNGKWYGFACIGNDKFDFFRINDKAMAWDGKSLRPMSEVFK